jgi:hypothetical protein
MGGRESPSKTPKRSRRLVLGSFVMNVRSEDMMTLELPVGFGISLRHCEGNRRTVQTD